MAELIIEVVNRLGHISERHKFNHLPVSIGRSYRNDLIVTDQHVSPQHLLLTQNESGWKLDDQGSHNGLFIRQTNNTMQHVDPSQDPISIHSGDEIIIGKTRLRFYAADHPVTETQMLPKQDAFSRHVGKPSITSTILICCIFAYVLNYQLSSSTDLSAQKLLALSLPPLFISLLWAGIWSFVGRVLKHESNFRIQYSTTLLFSLGILTITILKEYILYNSSGFELNLLLETILTGFLLSTLLYINLENGTNASVKTRLWTSHGIAWGILLGGMFLSYANKPDFRHNPSFPSALKPPFAKLVPSQNFSEFLQESETLFTNDADNLEEQQKELKEKTVDKLARSKIVNHI